MNEPETLPLIMMILGWCVLISVLAWIADRKTRRRNRWIDAPKPDPRSSIEQFRRINSP